MAGEIILERRARSNRNAGRHHRGFAGDFPRNPHLDRAKAYAAVGASGFFVPGLVEEALIGQICEGVSLPVNVMVMDGVPSNARLSELGVARISYGPIPYIRAMKALGQEAKTTLNEAAARTEDRP